MFVNSNFGDKFAEYASHHRAGAYDPWYVGLLYNATRAPTNSVLVIPASAPHALPAKHFQPNRTSETTGLDYLPKRYMRSGELF
jgi:hypothetical protein